MRAVQTGSMHAEQPSVAVIAAVRAVADALPLATARCQLRALRLADADAVGAYRGREDVSRYLGHAPLAPHEVRTALERWSTDPTSVTAVVALDGRIVGDVRLFFRAASAMAPASTDAVEAWVGYAFHPEVHGRGLARECVAAMLHLALSRAGVRRVTARVFAPARPSSRLLHALGFHLDGTDRRAVLSPEGETWWDDELWSLLPGELRQP